MMKMNRRNVLRLAGAAIAGFLCCLCWPVTGKLPKRKKVAREPLRLWLTDKFYVDLPEDRYTDSVDVAWARAKEWKDGPRDGPFVAQCCVRPNADGEWELFRMQRTEHGEALERG